MQYDFEYNILPLFSFVNTAIKYDMKKLRKTGKIARLCLSVQPFLQSGKAFVHFVQYAQRLVPFLCGECFHHGGVYHFEVNIAPAGVIRALLGQPYPYAAGIELIPHALNEARRLKPAQRYARAGL